MLLELAEVPSLHHLPLLLPLNMPLVQARLLQLSVLQLVLLLHARPLHVRLLHLR